MKLTYDFFNRYTVDVAQELLGKTLVFHHFKGIITETEAYRGEDDEASHAFKGMTKRTRVMFGPGGYTYVYMIYGMYYCLNFVAEGPGQAGAVLIRGLQLPDKHLDGPGKLCRHLGITTKHYGINLTHNKAFYVTEGVKVTKYLTTSRIGIRKGLERPWRFLLESFENPPFSI